MIDHNITTRNDPSSVTRNTSSDWSNPQRRAWVTLGVAQQMLDNSSPTATSAINTLHFYILTQFHIIIKHRRQPLFLQTAEKKENCWIRPFSPLMISNRVV
jgi:hypothetical protein